MSLQDCAYTLIDDLGKSVTLRKVTQGTYNPANGGVTNTTSDETVRACILNFSNREFDGTMILQGDRKIVIAAKSATEPQLNDLVIDGTSSYRIVSIRKVEENGTAVIYTCQGRIQ